MSICLVVVFHHLVVMLSQVFSLRASFICYAVAMDAASDSIYVTGIVSGSLDGQTFAGGIYDLMLLKYNTAGVWQWTQLRGTTSNDYGYGGDNFLQIMCLPLLFIVCMLEAENCISRLPVEFLRLLSVD